MPSDNILMENACCGINVKDFGAKGDAKKVSDGKIENKSDILNFKSDNFLKIGNIVNIEGAGKGGSMLSAEIKNVASLREVSINKQSLAKVDPANVTWGTNDSYAIQTAIDDVVKSGGAGIICVTPGTYILYQNLSVPGNVTLSFTDNAHIYLANGVTLNIAGSVCASANQIFAGSGTVIFGSGRVPRVYPQWWGAYSDGSPHEKETTAAIQAAMKSVFAPKVTKKIKNPATPPATYTLGSSQVVEFLAGHYKINDEIAVGPYANVITGSEAIIEQTDEAKNIFNFQNAYMIRISGLRFIGGYNQISLRQGRVDTLMYQIDHCEFEFARSYAIETTPVPPADHLSAVLTIDHCKFFLPWAVLNNRCDYAAVNNCWVTVNSDYTPQFTAIFVNGSCNSKTNGRLHFCNMFGVPGFSSGSHCRWIDNYGSVFVDDSRFGGEGAGMPIVYHYAKHWNRNGSWPRPPTSVVIRNSWVFTGYNDPNAAALNLQTEVPVVFIYEGNFGPANASDNPIIVNGAVPDLDEYIKKFPHNYFRFVIEPNEMTVHNLPEPLKALVNFIENEKVATSPPTTGMWERGQHLWNKEPTPGGIIGWVCVTSGSPGTWKPFGTIST